MRVTADRQTLILAGETPPRRAGATAGRLAAGIAGDTDESDETESLDQSSSRVTIISARVDAVVTQTLYRPNQQARVVDSSTAEAHNRAFGLATTAPAQTSSLPALAPEVHQAYVISNRGSASSAASAYARTRDLSERIPLIDTYA